MEAQAGMSMKSEEEEGNMERIAESRRNMRSKELEGWKGVQLGAGG